MVNIERLEIHAAHSCNFTCESCSHFSNQGHTGIISPDYADYQMGLWSNRINPNVFSVLGGEPLLNPKIEEFLIVTRKHWKNTIELVTNGFLLHKFDNLHKVLRDNNIHLVISQHHASEEYMVKFDKVLDLVRNWNCTFVVRESYKNWTRRHKGFGPNVLPYEDKNPRASWDKCPARICRQLFEEQIYKCSPITYLRVHKRRWPEISDKWDCYLSYKPLNHTCSDEEMVSFFNKNEEFICNMCSANLEKFEKPSPLIPLGSLLSRKSE